MVSAARRLVTLVTDWLRHGRQNKGSIDKLHEAGSGQASVPKQQRNGSVTEVGTAVIRGDFSERLIHLTRGDTDMMAMQAFFSIVRTRRLHGSNRDIRGGHKCVCFSEAPIAVMAQMVATRESRYAPLGVMVDKTWLFGKGGRPVIYQPESEFGLLPEALQYRHVRYEPGRNKNKDFSWEREWRLRAEYLELDPSVTTLVVPHRHLVEHFKEQHLADQQGTALGMGDMAFATLESMPRSGSAATI
jgi:hypothetical protein